MYYRKEDVKEEIERNIDWYETMLVAWEKVEFVTKKNGEPFANYGKNFSNATYKPDYSRLCVYGCGKKNGYINDNIYLIATSRLVTIEEAKHLIELRIEGYQRRIADLKSDLNELDNTFDVLESCIKELKAKISITASDSTYYALKEYAKYWI